MANTLGTELSTALSNITALIIATTSKAERDRLVVQQTVLAGRLQLFIDEEVERALPEYTAATAALKEANAQAVAAKKRLDHVAETIVKFATALDKVAALAAKMVAV